MDYFIVFGAIGLILSLIIYCIFFRETQQPSFKSLSFLTLFILASQIIVALTTKETIWSVAVVSFIGCLIFILPLAYYFHITDVFTNVIGYFWVYYPLKNILTQENIPNIQQVLIDVNNENSHSYSNDVIQLVNRKHFIGEIIWLIYSLVIILFAEKYASAISSSN